MSNAICLLRKEIIPNTSYKSYEKAAFL